MKTVFRYIHPVLPITAGLLLAAGIWLQGHGGPCPDPLILLLPLLLVGFFVGFVLSGVRTFRHFRKRHSTNERTR
jgi:hypothetical protein